MTILSKYIASELFKIFLISAVSLEAIYGVIDSVEKLKDFFSHHAPLATIGLYFAYRFVEVGFRVLPMAGLLSTILTLGILSKNHELTAIRASGISLIRATKPFLLLGIIITFLEIGLNYTFIPSAYTHTDYIKDVLIDQGGKRVSQSILKDLWIRSGDRYLFHTLSVESGGTNLFGVTQYEISQDFHLLETISAPKVFWTQNHWEFMNGVITTMNPDGSLKRIPFLKKQAPLDRRPEDFSYQSVRISRMTYPELVETIHVLKDSKLPTIRFETVKDGLVAFPVASFLMVLLAIPFGIREGRQVGIAKGFGLSLMFSLSYWVIYSLGISLGRGGVISPWLGAWFANIIVFSVAFVLYLMINRT